MSSSHFTAKETQAQRVKEITTQLVGSEAS